MSESVIADFTAQFNSDVANRADPIQGRVVLSQNRLVLAASKNDKLTIPVESIFDVNIGNVPGDLGDFFQSTVTIAFERANRRLTAAIEATDNKIQKFGTLLFKTILNGTKTTIKTRARVGGRVTGEDFQPAKLLVKPDTVEFHHTDGTFVIELTAVLDLARTAREIRGSQRPVLVARHMRDGTAITTEFGLASDRKMTILSRYLRLEYSELVEQLQDTALTEVKKEVLMALYSTPDIDGVSLASVLGRDSAEVSMLLQELQEDGLVQDGTTGTTLTPAGQTVASRHLRDAES